MCNWPASSRARVFSGSLSFLCVLALRLANETQIADGGKPEEGARAEGGRCRNNANPPSPFTQASKALCMAHDDPVGSHPRTFEGPKCWILSAIVGICLGLVWGWL